MKKLLLIALLIVGCEETVAPLTKHGCLDGQATNYDATASIDNNTCTYIDSCGVIDIDITNDCSQDCNGDWGGGSVIIDTQCIYCNSDCIVNYMVISQNYYSNVCTEAEWAVWFFTYDYKIRYFEFEVDNASIIELHDCGRPASNTWTVNVEDSKIMGESQYIYNLDKGLLVALDLDGEPSKLKNIKVTDESGVVREITYCSDDMNCLGWDGSTYMFTP